MLITPLTVKNAASSRRRSPGPDERVLVGEQRRDRRDAEPVRDADLEPEPGDASSATVPRWCSARADEARRARRTAPPTSAAPAPGRARGRRASRRGRSRPPRARPRRRAPTPATGSSPVTAAQAPTGASPSEAPSHDVAEPRDPLQVRVDDEEHDRDRPEPAHERVELEDGDEEDGEREPRRAPAPAPARAIRPAARATPCAGSARRARRRSAGSAPSRACGRRPSRP